MKKKKEICMDCGIYSLTLKRLKYVNFFQGEKKISGLRNLRSAKERRGRRYDIDCETEDV